MSPEELDKARADEAFHYAEEADPGANQSEKLQKAFARYRQHIVSDWTPPAPISPRLRAAREWLKERSPIENEAIDEGSFDQGGTISSFLAGVAWAVEKAGPLVGALKHCVIERSEWLDEARAALTTYRQEIGE